MDYLNLDLPALRLAPERASLAVQTLLDLALPHSRAFRLQFDRDRLLEVLDDDAVVRQLPGLADPAKPVDPATGLAIDEEPLNAEKRAALQQLLSFELQQWADLPLNYIQTVTLLDADGRILFRGRDMLDTVLFSLPAPDQAELIAAYARAGIPSEVIEHVAIDPAQLYP